jgi:restriction system protein
MSVPDYQNFMLPLLKCLEDRQVHSLKEIYDTLAEQFQLTEEELTEVLPSGKQSKFKNRVGWARTYLKKAGLLQTINRGEFQITDTGLEVLRNNPAGINSKYLERFSSFLEFKNKSQKSLSNKEAIEPEEESVKTPKEILESSYLELRSNLSEELLDMIKSCSPAFFEELVVDLLVAMGYGGSRTDAAQVLGKSGDEGIDGIIKEDKLGLDVLYIQAKRWQSSVGRPSIQTFAGSLEGKRTKKGIFITTSTYTPGALEYVKNIEKKIILIDGEYLAELMIDYNIGVSKQEEYVIKNIDHDYFIES